MASVPKQQRKSIWDRPADLVYVSFFAVHLVATLLIDGQDLYPALVPDFLRAVRDNYLATSADPVLPHAFTPAYAWFTSLIWIEVLFQVPVFVLGIWGLLRGTYPVHPLGVLWLWCGN